MGIVFGGFFVLRANEAVSECQDLIYNLFITNYLYIID